MSPDNPSVKYKQKMRSCKAKIILLQLSNSVGQQAKTGKNMRSRKASSCN